MSPSAPPNKTFSLNRSQQKARAAKQAPATKPGRKPAAAPAPAVAPAPKATGGDIISDIESVRKLIDKHGNDGLKRLVEALG